VISIPNLNALPPEVRRAFESLMGQLGVRESLALTDGVTVPNAATRQATIYIDVADGDLKIIFSDGKVKTIVADT
jgi:hypothetical protein